MTHITYPCMFHEETDADGEPTGDPCGQPATHVIYWSTGQVSYCCPEHIDPGFTDEAPVRVVEEL